MFHPWFVGYLLHQVGTASLCFLQSCLILLFMLRFRYLPFFLKLPAFFEELFVYHVGSDEKTQSLDGIHNFGWITTKSSHPAGFYLVVDVILMLEGFAEALEGIVLVEAH